MIRWYKVFNNVQDAEKRIPLNSIQLIVAKGRKICLVHTQSGFKAADDFCPHLGESLSKGNINFLNEIICPLHSYRFSLINGAECHQRAPDLAIHQVKYDETGFYVGLKLKS